MEYADSILITIAAIFVCLSPDRKVAITLFAEFSLSVLFYIWLNYNDFYVDGKADILMVFLNSVFMLIFALLGSVYLAGLSFVLAGFYLIFYALPYSVIAYNDFYILVSIQILQLSVLAPSIYRKYKRKNVEEKDSLFHLFEAVCGHAHKH